MHHFSESEPKAWLISLSLGIWCPSQIAVIWRLFLSHGLFYWPSRWPLPIWHSTRGGFGEALKRVIEELRCRSGQEGFDRDPNAPESGGGLGRKASSGLMNSVNKWKRVWVTGKTQRSWKVCESGRLLKVPEQKLIKRPSVSLPHVSEMYF